MSHDAFVFLAYGATALIFGLLVLWLAADRLATKQDIARLEKTGLRRRSQTADKSDD